MMIYKVIKGKLVSTEVIKETEKRYYIDSNNKNFSFASYLYKDEAFTTADSAITHGFDLAERRLVSSLLMVVEAKAYLELILQLQSENK